MLAAFLKFAAFFIMLPFYNYVVAANLHAAFLDCSLFTFRPTDFIRSHQYWFLLNHHSAIKVTEKDREAISLSRQVEDGSNFSLRKKKLLPK